MPCERIESSSSNPSISEHVLCLPDQRGARSHAGVHAALSARRHAVHGKGSGLYRCLHECRAQLLVSACELFSAFMNDFLLLAYAANFFFYNKGNRLGSRLWCCNVRIGHGGREQKREPGTLRSITVYRTPESWTRAKKARRRCG